MFTIGLVWVYNSCFSNVSLVACVKLLIVKMSEKSDFHITYFSQWIVQLAWPCINIYIASTDAYMLEHVVYVHVVEIQFI